MKRLLGVSLLSAVLLAIAASTASAGYCGALRHRCCKRACCEPVECTCCQQCYTVMKTCKEVVYEEREDTCYKTVFVEVVSKKKVPAVKFVPVTAYRCVCCDCAQPQECGGCCAPANSCSPAQSGGPTMVTGQILRKVPYETVKEVHYEKEVETKRIVQKQVPYTVIVCVPTVVYKQIPVQVCCPVPCCR